MQKRNSGTGNRTLGSAELIPQLISISCQELQE
ncbi:uncharacterized protein FFB20_06030 [Fusarium fujikuroi]|nr:uncharacterized protein FFB20_06030 [Fusarium fujikuroi]SCN83256.1 uncharacterized protein FFC1_04166 [Fusarium fujikuroi]SCN83656.1 uncharacterized protein FFE2_05479 [Fusarium fujikuroi]SCN86617.1 uncharacterized protein FFM5_03964 [Fusarium fujikuroi]SCO35285.1 uncharacterized protein FFNC_04336 [Fusarium fujikuroi]